MKVLAVIVSILLLLFGMASCDKYFNTADVYVYDSNNKLIHEYDNVWMQTSRNNAQITFSLDNGNGSVSHITVQGNIKVIYKKN